MLKQLFCLHYFEDQPKDINMYYPFLIQESKAISRTGFLNQYKAVICNKCNKIKIVDKEYKDIEYIGR